MEIGPLLRVVRTFEAFLQAETIRKPILGLLFLLLLLPRSGLLFLVVLFFAAALLPRDVQSRHIGLYLALPFTRPSLFFHSFLMGLFLLLLGAVIGGAIFGDPGWPTKFIAMAIFFSTMFSLSLIGAAAGRDTLTLPVLFLFADVTTGAALGVDHPFRWFSPFYQEEPLYAGLVAVLLLAAAFVQYLVMGRRI